MSESIELIPKTDSKQSAIASDIETEEQIERKSEEKIGEKPPENQKPNTSDKSIKEENRKTYLKKVRKLFIPVTICMIIVLVSLTFLPHYANVPRVPDGSLLIGNEDSPTGDKLKAAIITAVVFLVLAVVLTTLMALCIVWKCYRCLNIFLGITFSISMTITFITYFSVVMYTYNVPLDYITTALVVWNYVVIGVIAIFFDGPKFVRRAYHVFVSALVALTLNRMFPSWTTWALLFLFCLWDLYAVFCGPLKVIVKDKEALKTKLKLPVYTVIILETDETPKKEEKLVVDDDPGALGLGDFIFYSLLVGKTYTSTNMLVAIMCLVAILMGLILTLLCMVLFSLQAMPALPISVVLGLIVRFIGAYFIVPFNVVLVLGQIFI